MKLLTILAMLSFSILTLNAQTTMCYKENHTNMATINTVKLDGGICKGEKSIQDMQKDGWTTEDIKINNNNYIYIFKKITSTENVNMEELENRVLQRIQKQNVEKSKLKKEKITKSKIQNGKRIYTQECALCHGNNGEKSTYGKEPINTLNLLNFKSAIREYVTGERTEKRKADFGNKITPYAKIMLPYANKLTSNKINNIYLYLKSIKPTKVDK